MYTIEIIHREIGRVKSEIKDLKVNSEREYNKKLIKIHEQNLFDLEQSLIKLM